MSVLSDDDLRRMAAPEGTHNTLESTTAAIKVFLAQAESASALVMKLWLPSPDRRKLYQWLEEHHGRETVWQMDQVDNYRQLTLLHPKQSDFEQMRAKFANGIGVTDQHLFWFNKFYKVQLPVCLAATGDYYLNRLEPYRQTATKFAAFKRDIQRAGNLGKFRTQMQVVEAAVTQHLKTHPSVVAFQDNPFDEHRAVLLGGRKGSGATLARCDRVYKEPQAGKCFISIDIRKANFTVLRHFYPDIFQRDSTGAPLSWGDFMATFDTMGLETLRDSKHLREVIFGNIGVTKKTCWLSEVFILQLAKKHGFQAVDVALLSGDEVVVPYTPELYRALHAEYHAGDFYKVQAFRLLRMLERDFYVKEYFDAKGSGSIAVPTDSDICAREIKCVAAKNVMEVICHYERRAVTDLDLRFTDESGRVAQFIDPLVK